MNRNILKIIGAIAMVVDHVGRYLLDGNIVCRIIGRLAFPIFAFFVAEGMRHTRSRKKYLFSLLIFALISQVPYMFLTSSYKLNILFTLLFATVFIVLIEKIVKEREANHFASQVWFSIGTFVLLLCCFTAGILGYIDYSILGIILVLIFYFTKSYLKYILSAIAIILMTLENILKFGFSFSSCIQIFALISLMLLVFYNNHKGKLNMKYFFYTFYPTHLLIIFLISLVV